MNHEENKSKKDGHKTPTRFPITKPGLCSTKPKFPYKDTRHYVDPCCDFPKSCQIGSTAQIALEKSQVNHFSQCHSPELPTSHPWFEPSN